MKCEDALLLISGHIDQENTPEEEAQLLQHLQQCAECRKVLQAFEEMNSSLAALNVEPPADLRRNVMEVIRTETAVPKKHNRRWISLAAAAALAIVIGAAAIPKFTPAPAEDDEPMMARSVPFTAETLSADFLEQTPQEIADAKQAAVVVVYELYPELEVCECETLENGALLYCLENADSAEVISEQYDLELFLPERALADASYALLLLPQ